MVWWFIIGALALGFTLVLRREGTNILNTLRLFLVVFLVLLIVVANIFYNV